MGWIRSSSGEWLKREPTRVREDQVEFDSDEFDNWQPDLSVRTTLRSENTNQAEISGDAEIVRETALNRLELS